MARFWGHVRSVPHIGQAAFRFRALLLLAGDGSPDRVRGGGRTFFGQAIRDLFFVLFHYLLQFPSVFLLRSAPLNPSGDSFEWFVPSPLELTFPTTHFPFVCGRCVSCTAHYAGDALLDDPVFLPCPVCIVTDLRW